MPEFIVSLTAIIFAMVAAYVIVNFREFQQTESTKTFYRHEVNEHVRNNRIVPRKVITRQTKHHKNC